MNFISAVEYHFCPSLPAAFTQPGASTLANLCKETPSETTGEASIGGPAPDPASEVNEALRAPTENEGGGMGERKAVVWFGTFDPRRQPARLSLSSGHLGSGSFPAPLLEVVTRQNWAACV